MQLVFKITLANDKFLVISLHSSSSVRDNDSLQNWFVNTPKFSCTAKESHSSASGVNSV